MKKPNPLSDFEQTLLWMAIRYAMNRQSIASATLPTDIISNWYHRLSKNDKERTVIDLQRNLQDFEERAFGDPGIDKPIWIKFMNALDENCHIKVKLIDDTEEIVFPFEDEYIPLASYIATPYRHIFIPKENIKEFL